MIETVQAFCDRVKAYNADRPAEEQMETAYQEPMSRHTSFRIGGPAAFYLTPHTAEDVRALCGFLRETGAKYTILGNGSNVLFDDEGYDGTVISMAKLNVVSAQGNTVTAGDRKSVV